MIKSRIGTVHLNVADMDKLLVFYQNVLGLQLHRQTANQANLGVGEEDLLVLHHTPDLQRVTGRTGLFHFALLVPTRQDLGLVLKHFAQTQTQLQGLSEHFVSEAIYLADPEGNGIEIYRDRPRDAWYRNGQLHMTTAPMDVEGVLDSINGDVTEWSGLPAGTVMGHIHLHVSDVPKDEQFYTDVLGMDALFNWGSATFMSYDGYHHHVGANIWGGRMPMLEPALGLSYYELRFDDLSTINQLTEKLHQQGLPVEETSEGFFIRDASANQILLKSFT